MHLQHLLFEFSSVCTCSQHLWRDFVGMDHPLCGFDTLTDTSLSSSHVSAANGDVPPITCGQAQHPMDNLTSALCRIVRSTELDDCVLLSARHRYGAPRMKKHAFGRHETQSLTLPPNQPTVAQQPCTSRERKVRTSMRKYPLSECAG